MIHDATVEVTCDECSAASVTVEPEYVYNDYSGKSGHYDTHDSSIHRLIEREGWTVAEDGRHLCETCSPDEEEDEDD